jgi:hypothetical protein
MTLQDEGVWTMHRRRAALRAALNRPSIPRRLGACAVIVLSVLAGMATPAVAHPGVPSARFDPNVAAWASYRNILPWDFNDRMVEQRSAGRMLVDFDKDRPTGSDLPLYGAVFQRNTDGRDWYILDEVLIGQFWDTIEDQRAAGMRLADLEAYHVNSQLRWSMLWVENVEGYAWNATYGPTYEVEPWAETERAAGRMLIDIDMFRTHQTNQCCLAAAVSVRNVENLAWTPVFELTSGEFNAVYQVLRSTHRPLVADSGTSPTGQRFSAVWVENRNGRGWYIYRGLTREEWIAKWDELSPTNRLINSEQYTTPDGVRYLGVWRQNN